MIRLIVVLMLSAYAIIFCLAGIYHHAAVFCIAAVVAAGLALFVAVME